MLIYDQPIKLHLITMSQQNTESPLINPQACADLAQDLGSDAVKHLVGLFLENLPGYLSAIERSAAVGEHNDLSRAGHTLKSAARFVGAQRLANLAYQIETSATLLPPLQVDLTACAQETAAALRAQV